MPFLFTLFKHISLVLKDSLGHMMYYFQSNELISQQIVLLCHNPLVGFFFSLHLSLKKIKLHWSERREPCELTTWLWRTLGARRHKFECDLQSDAKSSLRRREQWCFQSEKPFLPCIPAQGPVPSRRALQGQLVDGAALSTSMLTPQRT